VILMRDPLELLMVRRTPAARFMAGHWVFPGGAVDAADGEGQTGLRAAAVRELREETAIELDGELVAFARWITPAGSPIRFDTWFYLAAVARDVEARVDGDEIVDSRWLTPAAALAAAASGELELALPTQKQLELLSLFATPADALAHARGLVDRISPVEPWIEGSGANARIVLPDDANQRAD
jgi:8-oxo-dGTP pyrophosphatase MutT (NUDIX family)